MRKRFSVSLMGLGLLVLVGCTAKNEPPSARILQPVNNARTNERTIAFKAEISDPEDQLRSTLWSFGDGSQEAGGAEVTHTYSQGGAFTVHLTVTDQAGQSDTAAVRVEINRRPVAAARAQVQVGEQTLPFVKVIHGVVPLEVQFEGSRSQDPDGELQSFHWDFGDGTTSDEPDPRHTYETADGSQAVLTVTDQEGLSASDRVVLKLAARPVRVSDVVATSEEVPHYQLIKGSSTPTASGVALYQYRLVDPGPFSEEQVRLALLDALSQLALKSEALNQITLYLFTEPKAGFMDPGDYDHYLGMAQWERPQGSLSQADLVRSVVNAARLTLNERYLDGSAPTVVGYKLTTVPLGQDDPRCGEVCQTSTGTMVQLVLAPQEQAGGQAPELCRQQVMTTIRAVLDRALAAPGGYWLNVYAGSIGSRGLAVGLWAVGVDIEGLAYDNPLLFDHPSGWEIDSEGLRLHFVQELPDCGQS